MLHDRLQNGTLLTSFVWPRFGSILNEGLHGLAQLVDCCFHDPDKMASGLYRFTGSGTVVVSAFRRAQYVASNFCSNSIYSTGLRFVS